MSVALARQEPTPSARPHAAQHFPLGEHEFQRIIARLEAQTGITMSPDKHTLVHSRLQRRVRTLGLPDFRAYCDFIEGPDGQAEQVHFVNALTTNLTSFFRESHHFKHLVEDALAPFVSTLRSGGRLRIWSAGCSTGEEPFCIAMMLMSICPQAYEKNARILASDIDSNVLRSAFRGEYAENQMKGVPAPLLEKFFDRDQRDGVTTYRANEDLRRIISFRKLNLNASSWPMSGKFDVIFCRNTLIYFDDDRQAEILARFRRALNPGGYLYIGHSERIKGTAETKFKRVGVTIFQAV